MRTVLIVSLLIPAALRCQSDIPSALERLAKNPADKDAVRALSGKYDPRVIEAFKAAFDLTTDPEIKSDVASNLIDDGIVDSKYFEYLADAARPGIEDDAPHVLALDAGGNEIKGQLNPEFEKWCMDHGQELPACARDHMYVLPFAVTKLAILVDDRASNLLLQGLRSKNPIVVVACIHGLGALGKTGALPLIAQLMAQAPASIAEAYATALVEFDNPASRALIDRYVTDETIRAGLKRGVGGIYKTVLERRKQRGIIQ
jgi:hypothetical protein